MQRRTKKRLIALAIALGLYTVMRVSGLGHYFSLATIKTHRAYLLGLVAQNYAIAAASYVVLYTLIVAFSVPAAAPLTITGGFLFGALPTTIFVNIGATVGAAGIFLLVRYFTRNGRARAHGGVVQKFNREIAENGHSYLLVLRLIPIFPFFLINIAAALSPVPLYTFVWTTALGIIPGSYIFAYAGRQLATIEHAGDVLSREVLVAFLLLALLALVPVIYKRLRPKA